MLQQDQDLFVWNPKFARKKSSFSKRKVYFPDEVPLKVLKTASFVEKIK